MEHKLLITILVLCVASLMARDFVTVAVPTLKAIQIKSADPTTSFSPTTIEIANDVAGESVMLIAPDFSAIVSTFGISVCTMDIAKTVATASEIVIDISQELVICGLTS